MINEKMYGLGDEPSAIRELFAYGMARKAEIGAENVFDFSIGNPSVPAPELVRETMLELLDMDPVALHAYSPAAGLPEVKEAIAAYLSERYDTTATSGHLYLTAGAAAALASSIAAVTHPGDEVVVVSPYFPEYRTWIEAAGCTIVEVPAAVPSFQPDIEALRAAIGPKTSAVIINTPNNPVGAVYTRESLEALAAMLRHELGGKAPAPYEPLFTSEWAFPIIAHGDGSRTETVDLVGNLCCAADVLEEDFTGPALDIGDLIEVRNAGAYACTLTAQRFSSHTPPQELLVHGDGRVETE